MRVCVFCSSAAGLAEKYVDAAADLGRALGEHGHELVFGGFDTGLMGNVAHAARDAGARVVGVLPCKAGELPGRPVFPCDELIECDSLAARKVCMEERSDAFVALPGSYGTLDELYDVLAVEKLLGGTRPSALLDVDGFYAPLAELHARMVADGLMSADHAALCGTYPTVGALMDALEASDRS